jgi:hypothetical protein
MSLACCLMLVKVGSCSKSPYCPKPPPGTSYDMRLRLSLACQQAHAVAFYCWWAASEAGSGCAKAHPSAACSRAAKCLKADANCQQHTCPSSYHCQNAEPFSGLPFAALAATYM